jgi:four helix bundle protein
LEGEFIVQDFHELIVWRKAHEFTLQVYKITKRFPKEELYGITDQIRRASVSIPANIAEGCGKDSRADFARYIQIAIGSSSEVEYFILLARDLSFLNNDEFNEFSIKITEIKRMLSSLRKKVRS